MADLEILVPNQRVANWMVINNLLHGKPATTIRWDGLLFSLFKEITVFPGGLKKGLATVALSGPAFEHVITADEFDDGDFVYVSTRANAPVPPSDEPLVDAKKFWNDAHPPAGPRTLSKHAKPLGGGIVVWRYEGNDLRFTMPSGLAGYKFECDAGGSGLDIRHYKDGAPVAFPSGTVIDRITLNEFVLEGDPAPGDIMMPPRYP